VDSSKILVFVSIFHYMLTPTQSLLWRISVGISVSAVAFLVLYNQLLRLYSYKLLEP